MVQGYTISTDRAAMDLDRIHAYLADSYWARGIPREIVRRSIDHSLCFAVLTDTGEQIGFARVITDSATFAYLADVFILDPHRGQGLSKWLVQTILDDPALQGLRRFMLATHDAHGLYQRYGFTPLTEPQRLMEIRNRDVYAQTPSDAVPAG